MPSFIMYLHLCHVLWSKINRLCPHILAKRSRFIFFLSYNVHFFWCTEWPCIGRWCTDSREKNPWTKSGNYCREAANSDHIAYCCKIHLLSLILTQLSLASPLSISISLTISILFTISISLQIVANKNNSKRGSIWNEKYSKWHYLVTSSSLLIIIICCWTLLASSLIK